MMEGRELDVNSTYHQPPIDTWRPTKIDHIIWQFYLWTNSNIHTTGRSEINQAYLGGNTEGKAESQWEDLNFPL